MKKQILLIALCLSALSEAGAVTANDSTMTRTLGEVVVKAQRKYVRQTPRGIKISMNGNPLSEIGSATAAIKQMPLIDSAPGSISVVGKGNPAIYINGRLMRNPAELEMLTSKDIESVEIITNPPAKYGSEVSSVLLIKTRNPNRGLYAKLSGEATASELWSEQVNGSVGYHSESGFTFFGDMSYGDSRFRQERSYDEKFTDDSKEPDKFFSATSDFARNRSQTLTADGGVNYDFGKNHIGIKYTFSRTPSDRFKSFGKTVGNTLPVDTVTYSTNICSQSHRHYLNMYGYFTLPREITLRIDADYINGSSKSADHADEDAGTNIVNHNFTDIRLCAGKIEFEKTIQNVSLSVGSDYTYTENKQHFTSRSNDEADSFLKPSTDDVTQKLFSAFFSFDYRISKMWNIYGGLRYDATNTDYVRNGVRKPELSKDYGNWLPDIGVSFSSDVALSLYYRQRVYRPTYSTLDNNYNYVTPTLWETGNPELQAMRSHEFGFNLSFKKFFFQASASSMIDKIGYNYDYSPEIGANVNTCVNLPNYSSLQLVGVQQLDLGIWHPTFQGILLMQDLDYGNPRRSYHKPYYRLSMRNRFDLPKKIYAYLTFTFFGAGNVETQYCKSSWQTALTLSKSYRDWTFSLAANDIFGTWKQRVSTQTNNVSFSSVRKGASQSVSLTVQYRFKTAKGKYRGKSVRDDEINRL